MKSNQFSFRSRVNSFRFAGEGIVSFLQKEHNAWLHVVATVAVSIAGVLVKITMAEWLAVLFAIGLVWVTEMINTCMEKLIDFVAPGQHPQLKFIKDVAAGAVLVAAIIALIVGLIIFIPHII